MAPLVKTILPGTSADVDDRRSAIRYQITVSAEVVETKSGTRFSTRTTDLGPGGCFVDTLMPLPVGADVRVRLHKDNIKFEALGSVTFSQTGLGMGIAFNEMPPERQTAFDAWLAELTMAKPVTLDSHRAQEIHIAPPSATSDAGPSLAQNLIRLLVKRGIISEADAASLRDPLL
jgi:hypothetical protein